MKNALLCLFAIVAGNVLALSDADWIAKAKSCVEQGRTFEFGKTVEDGYYCLVMSEVIVEEGVSRDRQDREAEQVAQRRVNAYINGEQMSGEQTSEDHLVSNGESETATSEFKSVIKSKSASFSRGFKVIGRIKDKDEVYLVCVTTERAKDESLALAKAQASRSAPDTVRVSGRGTTREQAIVKAKKAAVGQVLGSVVVDFTSTDSDKGVKGQTAGGADGFVETYEVVSEKTEDGQVVVEIVAKVSRGTPLDRIVFYVEAPYANTAKRLTELIAQVGIRITTDPDSATHIVRCSEEFEESVHPATGRPITRVTTGIKVQNIRTGEDIYTIVGEKPGISKLSSASRRKELAAAAALKNIEEEFQSSLADVVARIVRREKK